MPLNAGQVDAKFWAPDKKQLVMSRGLQPVRRLPFGLGRSRFHFLLTAAIPRARVGVRGMLLCLALSSADQLPLVRYGVQDCLFDVMTDAREDFDERVPY
jgi:hypothetical protein